MEAYTLIVLIAILIVIVAVLVYNKAIDKKRTISRINLCKRKLSDLEETFINEESERVIQEFANDILMHIEKKQYVFDEALSFKIFVEDIHSVVHNNNLKVLENKLNPAIDAFNKSIDSSKYITSGASIQIREKFAEETTWNDISDKDIEKYDSPVLDEYRKIKEFGEEIIEKANRRYIEGEKKRSKELFDNLDGLSLDDNQRNAAVNGDDRQLVVAGAGCGKTLTMAAKVTYLTEITGMNKSDILLLSFTRKAAEEMSDRLHRIGIDVESYTFHKYGLEIITKVQGKQPDVYDDMQTCLENYYREILSADDEEAKAFLNFIGLMLLPNYDSDDSYGERMLADKAWSFTTLKDMYMSRKNKVEDSRLIKEIEDLRTRRDSLDKVLKDKPQNKNGNIKELIGMANGLVSEGLLTKAFADEIKAIESKEKTNDSAIINDIRNLILEAINTEIKTREQKRLTIKRELLKSREEVKIANFLFLNGIDYEYEREYPFDNENNSRKKYRPDFYLPEYDIYIEHFGINKQGAAPQLSHSQEQEYLNGMRWKRALHKMNGTSLIETYSWQFADGSIEDRLLELFEEYGIETKKLDYGEIINEILCSNEYYNSVNSVETLLKTFISLFKSNNYKLTKFDNLIRSCEEQMMVEIEGKKTTISYSENLNQRYKDGDIRSQMQRDIAFLKVAKSFYTYYSKYLAENGLIDFNDMINMATNYVANGTYEPIYKYVIVDEYQDISMGRYRLINETLQCSGAKLFCVGDDWQSIYKFTGSEVSLLTDFEDYFGPHSRIDIVNTYRNSQELLNIAGGFIMKNETQLNKHLQSSKHIDNPVSIIYFSLLNSLISKNDNDEYRDNKRSREQFTDLTGALEIALSKIAKTKSSGNNLLLGRNNDDINRIDFDSGFHKKTIEDRTVITHDSYPGVKIDYMTIHKAKGLEYDNVILLNMYNSIAGFPNQMADDPILDLLRNDEKESFPFAEERRLFYVALTRSRNRVFILSPDINYSVFLGEIKDASEEIKTEGYGRDNAISCPNCETGFLVIRRNAAGKDFVGCTNYPMCTFTAPDTKSIYNNKKHCPRCGGYLVERNGKYGRFYGCANYPRCTYTENLDGTHWNSSSYNNRKNYGRRY